MKKDARELNVGIRPTPEIQKSSWGMFLFPDGIPAGYLRVASATDTHENVTFHIYAFPNDVGDVQAQMGKRENASAFAMMLRGTLSAADNPDQPIRLKKMKYGGKKPFSRAKR